MANARQRVQTADWFGAARNFSPSRRFLVVFVLQLLATTSSSLNITKMQAPRVADPREDMQLQCHFNMGQEELFAVKWYKDDHEFFRYSPSMTAKPLKFPVPGVHVSSDPQWTQCRMDRCDLLLTNLSRRESSGEYRCEVSSEAPAFRIAVRTVNITVAALPREKPRIEDLADSYDVGDYLTARCISAPGEPKPHLSFSINKQQVPSKNIKELQNPFSTNQRKNINLETTEVQLRIQLERRHAAPDGKMEIACTSSISELSPEEAPRLTATRTVTLIDNNYINNQKLAWPNSLSGYPSEKCDVLFLVLLVFITAVRWW